MNFLIVNSILMLCLAYKFIAPSKTETYSYDESLAVIIPATGRATLHRSIMSLIQQENPKWVALVGFDGIAPPSSLVPDKRIHYYVFPKIGGGFNHGGYVRNALINRSSSDWVAFLDDDDTFRPTYINTFFKELEHNKNADCIVFRMSYDKKDLKVLPPIGLKRPIKNLVGISFAVRRAFLVEHNIKFRNSPIEDYILLIEIFRKQGLILFSTHITYNVRH